MICAACTARYATVTDHGQHPCDHDASHLLAPLARQDLSIPTGSEDRAPRVDIVTLSQLWEQGREAYARLSRYSWRPDGRAVDEARSAVRQPWGGVTLAPSGPVVRSTGYAVAIRARLAQPLSFPIGDTFTLPHVVAAPYLGVFRDEEAGRIDIDPVAIVDTLREAQALSVYCRATGGAYDFATGNGFWAPTL
jgi:hypothetical protein